MATIRLTAAAAGFHVLDENGDPDNLDVFGAYTSSIGYWFDRVDGEWIWRENADGDIDHYKVSAIVDETVLGPDLFDLTVFGLNYTRVENGIDVQIGTLSMPGINMVGGTTQRIGATVLNAINDPANSFRFIGSNAVDIFDTNVALIGWHSDAVFNMRGGDDEVDLSYSSGDTTIRGGSGDDTLRSGSGDDVHYGGGGADFFFSGDGDDYMSGGKGNDGLDQIFSDNYLGIGDDTFEGGAGADVANGGDGNDVLWGASEADDGKLRSETRDGGDVLYGRGGNDSIFGNQANDSLYGGDGHDTIFGGREHDFIIGGDGHDSIYGDGLGNDPGSVGHDYAEGNDGRDFIFGGAGRDTLKGGAQDDEILGGLHRDELHGDDGADLLDGGAGGDSIRGGDGSDTIKGGSGNDTIEGGNGADIIIGGTGNDILVGGRSDDRFVFSDDSGKDRIEDFQVGQDSIEIQTTETIEIRVVDQGLKVTWGDNRLLIEDVYDPSSIDFI